MPSIIEGYNYDIFISYRQKDNKGDRWVSQFVEALRTELESTFKEDISVYFDINPHDGLLETHDVDESLKEKLKCLIFIPIISRTYCDPKAFAWEHEFMAFVEQASKDEYGLKIRLPNGNVVSRVLPIIIHDLDKADIKKCESILGGVMRGVEFIYKEPGVNRPLTPKDNEDKNLNNTNYRNQINKTALAIRETISGSTNEPSEISSEIKAAIEDKPTVKEKSIIVLPFENISPDPDQEYFSDGLTEEIITDLSQIHTLRVISRNSAMIFKGSRKSTKYIGKELNVQYVLEGSVRKAGNQLRITAQLIDAINDKHLWAEKYDGTLENIFDIQEQVSRAIVESLRLRLTDKEDKLISTRAIEDVQAYECHLRAIYNIWLTTEDALERALQYVNSGLNIIGKNEILYADKGQVYIHYMEFVVGKDEIYLKKAEQCVQEIFALNPNSARGHFLNGLIIRNRGKPQEAVKEFKKAIEMNPDDPNFLTWLSWVYGHSGHCDAARLLSDRLLVIDPLSPLGHIGTTDLFEGKFKTAAESFKKCNQLEEGNPFYRFWYAKALAYGQSIDEAIKIFELIFEETPDTMWAQLSVFFIKSLQYKKNEALESVPKETMQMFQNDEMFPIWVAESYALINDKDEAIKWLEHAVNWGFINYPFLNEYDPFLENIRGEDRFKKLMKRVKHEWENFEI